jgi:internalin A
MSFVALLLPQSKPMSHHLFPLAVSVLLLAGCGPSASTPPQAATQPHTHGASQAATPPDDAEDQAVKAVEKLGGQVVRDPNDPAKPIVEVNLNGAAVTDAELKELAALKALKGVQTLYLVNHHGVTDAGVKSLAGLKGLTRLNLDGTTVTDAGLKELADLKGLKELNLVGTQVTDAGLKELARLKGLKELNLFGTKVTDAGLKELADLKELKELNLVGTQVTDPGVVALQKALPDCKIDR